MIDQVVVLLESISILSVCIVGLLMIAIHSCDTHCKNKIILFCKGFFFLLIPIALVIIFIMSLELLLGGVA